MDGATVDELDVEIHFPKEGVVLSRDSRSSEKFMHGIKVLMAKNYIDNLSEETRKGMQEKAEQGIWPTQSPLGYRNVAGPDGKLRVYADFAKFAAGLQPGDERRLSGVPVGLPVGLQTVADQLRFDPATVVDGCGDPVRRPVAPPRPERRDR